MKAESAASCAGRSWASSSAPLLCATCPALLHHAAEASLFTSFSQLSFRRLAGALPAPRVLVSGELCRKTLQPPALAEPEGVQVAGQEEGCGHGSSLVPGLTYGVLVLQQGRVPAPRYTEQRGEKK